MAMVGQSAKPANRQSGKPANTHEMARLIVEETKEFLNIKNVDQSENLSRFFKHDADMNEYLNLINRMFGVEIRTKDFLRAPTIGNIIFQIKNIARDRNSLKHFNTQIKPAGGVGNYPLSGAQKRLWVLNELDQKSTSYVSYRIFSLSKVNISVFRKSLQALADRHESLRTVFVRREDGPVQIIKARVKVNLQLTDFSNTKINNFQIGRIIDKETSKLFDLGKGPLFRTALIKLSPDKNIFIFTAHHIATDRESMAILFRELPLIYTALISGQMPVLPPLPVQYKDFAVYEQSAENEKNLKGQEKYWLNKFSGDLPVLDLPTDKSRPPRQTHHGATEHISIGKNLFNKINTFCRKNNVTVFVYFFAVINVLLHRVTGQTDIIIGAPGTVRDRLELENVVGLFLNNLALRSDLSGDPKFIDFPGTMQEHRH